MRVHSMLMGEPGRRDYNSRNESRLTTDMLPKGHPELILTEWITVRFPTMLVEVNNVSLIRYSSHVRFRLVKDYVLQRARSFLFSSSTILEKIVRGH